MLCTGMETWYSTQYISKQARYSLCRENMGKRQQETPIIIVIYIILYLCHEFLLTVSTFQTLYFFADLPMNIMTQWCHLPWTIFSREDARRCLGSDRSVGEVCHAMFSSNKKQWTSILEHVFINKNHSNTVSEKTVHQRKPTGWELLSGKTDALKSH